MVNRVRSDLNPGAVHREQLVAADIPGPTDEARDNVSDRCEPVSLEDRERRRVEILVAVVEGDDDGTRWQGLGAAEVGAYLVEVDRMVSVGMEPIHLSFEHRRRDREPESQRVRARRRRRADVVVHQDGHADHRRADRDHVAPLDEIFAAAGVGPAERWGRDLLAGRGRRDYRQ